MPRGGLGAYVLTPSHGGNTAYCLHGSKRATVNDARSQLLGTANAVATTHGRARRYYRIVIWSTPRDTGCIFPLGLEWRTRADRSRRDMLF